MFWQAQSNMWFAEIGGYVIHPVGPNRASSFSGGPPVLDELLNVRAGDTVFEGTVPPLWRSQALAELQRSGARSVIVGGPSHFLELIHTVEQLLGRAPDKVEGGVAIWRLD
jgi:hypothetical protein